MKDFERERKREREIKANKGRDESSEGEVTRKEQMKRKKNGRERRAKQTQSKNICNLTSIRTFCHLSCTDSLPKILIRLINQL